MLIECANCGHDGPVGEPGSDHKIDEEGKFGEAGREYCEADGFFDDGTPECDCDLYEEVEDDDSSED